MVIKMQLRALGTLFILLLPVLFNTAFASTPPPPVNQKIGIPDGLFNDLKEADCRGCHERIDQRDPDRLVKPQYLPDRHHLKVHTPIGERSDAPFPEMGENGNYTCLVCHATQSQASGNTGYLKLNYRNCLNCHKTQYHWTEATVHHRSEYALERNCKHCHGSLIDNPFDGHFIPKLKDDPTCSGPDDPECYNPTSTTPLRSRGTGPNGAGACTFCHSPGINVDPEGDPLAFDGKQIQMNLMNHHNTGVIWDPETLNPELDSLLENPADPCSLCHSFDRPMDQQIRYNCGNCHGMESLHSIEAMDTSGDGVIIPGEEKPYYGHIGHPDNCAGCHGSSDIFSAASLPSSGLVAVPYIEDIINGSFTAGQEATVTLLGTAFVSGDFVYGDNIPVYVTVEQHSTVLRTLAALSATENEVQAILPADLAPGSYVLRVKIGDNEDAVSNPMPISLKPPVIIHTTTITNGLLSISGQGFSGYMAAADSGTKVNLKVVQTAGAGRFAQTTENNVACSIDSWSDTEIIANCGLENCGVVELNTIFGSASAVAAECTSGMKRKKERRFFFE